MGDTTLRDPFPPAPLTVGRGGRFPFGWDDGRPRKPVLPVASVSSEDTI